MSENKIQNHLAHLIKVEGVYLADESSVIDEFESFYIGVRKAEKRLLSDKEVAGLPVLKNNPHTNEWKKRARSAQRVGGYFLQNKSGSLLDLGCGNGWFTAMLAKNDKMEVLGMDINLKELKQAARVFHLANLNFVYGDIFQTQFPENTFDFIIINAVIQYFKNLDSLINRLFAILKLGGEIHIIDSPFYESHKVVAAKARTVKYYTDKGFPEMSQYYYHHSWNEIAKFDPVTLYAYQPKSKIVRIFEKPDIPFPWIKIIRKDG